MNKKETVIRFINKNIADGVWKPGDIIDSENVMAKKLGFQRTTVREAVSVLANEGVLLKKHGLGTFVTSQNAQKYIVISILTYLIIDIIGEPYRFLANNLKKQIVKSGYIPYMFSQNNRLQIVDQIDIDPNEIGGIILLSESENVYKYFDQKQIPIISLLNIFPQKKYSVFQNYGRFYKNIYEITKNYSDEKVLTFSFEREFNKNQMDAFIHTEYESFFENKYKLVRVPYSQTLEETGEIVKNTLLNMKDKPEILVFFDDLVYMSASLVLEEMKDYLKDVKIITYSSGFIKDIEGIETVKMGFDLEETAQIAWDIMTKLLNKETVYNPIVRQEPKIY